MSDARKKILDLFRSSSRTERRSQDCGDSQVIETRHRHQPKNRSSPTSGSKYWHDSNITRPIPSVVSEEVEDQNLGACESAITAIWPPPGFSVDGSLSPHQAREFIARGVPTYKGHQALIPHTSKDYFHLYATCDGVKDGISDCAKFYKPAFAAISFQLQGPGIATQPWGTLEQPSLAFCYGDRPGTITLNHWISLSGKPKPTIALRDPGVRPREVDLATIFDRLIFLEGSFEEDHEDLMYKNLYKKFLKDPDKYFSPHKAMEKQIADLIIVLSGPQWIDFSDPRNQIVAKFFTNADDRRYKTFFHQLVLSTELDIRIHSKNHADLPKQKLLAQLPPCIAWDLALARKWRECISIEKYEERTNSKQIKFQLLVKKRQVKALRRFARAMKWPNLVEVDEVLKPKGREPDPQEEKSSDSMSYFTGVILPGSTLPWLLMNSLIDCDKENGKFLSALTHMYPQCGFQYRSSTYWSSRCIVGKVLGPTCREIAGWVGPGRPAPDLERIQIARIRQRRPKQHMAPEDVRSMNIRSDPLGPLAKEYPIAEYQLALPDVEDIPNTIRIEKLILKPVADEQSRGVNSELILFDACIQFAIGGRSWPLRLSFDVEFIYAYPCIGVDAPIQNHPLFYDYVYQAAKANEILTIESWGGSASRTSPSTGAMGSLQTPKIPHADNDVEKVLVIEAFGVPDNEVLARAWSSHWGLSAIVANVHRTCMACAIREAYAACLNVVILVEDQQNDYNNSSSR